MGPAAIGGGAVNPEGPPLPRRLWPGFLAALLVVMVAAASLQPIRSYDLGWHLASGRLILAEGRIPTQDPFSFTRAGTPWLDHEWLFQVAAFLLFRLGGGPALLGLTFLLALGTGLLLVAWMRSEGVGGPVLAALFALSLAGARIRFDARPEMASLFFVLALLSILHWSRSPRREGVVWLLPPLFLVWANIHPAAVLGVALLALWMAGEAGTAWLSGKAPAGGVRRAAVCLLSPLFLLANPGGWRLLEVPFRIRSIVLSGHAPNQEWAAPTLQQFPHLYWSVAAALLVLGFGFKRIDIPPVLVTALAAVLAFQHARNLGLYFLLLPVALARPAAYLEERVRFPRREGRLVSAALLLILSAHLVRGNLEASRRGVLDAVEPRRAVEYLESRGLGRRLFNDVLFGGYLVWRRYPEHRVFVDGRNEVYDSLLAEIFDAVNSGEKWQALLDRYGIDAALIRRGQMQAVQYPPVTPGGAVRTELRAFSASHFPSAAWALVYWDDKALVLVRRDDPAAAPLLGEEYRFHPDDVPHLLALLRRGEVDRDDVLGELARKLREDPECRSARTLRDLVASAPGGVARSS